jgi:predicted transcriptional regulator
LPRQATARAAPQTAVEREQRDRLDWEAEGITEAHAELDIGLYVDADDIDAWINSMDTDHELPPPTRHR